jgi:hypothetical protein
MDRERFRYYTAWTAVANERAFAAPADPWRLLHVDPGDVDRFTNALSLLWGVGRIQGGDWHAAASDATGVIRENRVYRGLSQRFDDGRPWADTDLYAWAAERYAAEGSVRGYDTLEDFREVRLAFLDDLYATIRDEGYRPNRDAGHEPADASNEFETAYANELEPLVAIAPDGEILWVEGYHRFAIADLLDLDAIPVLVCCRHADWQARRDAIATGDAERARSQDLHGGFDVEEHPDLADLDDLDAT